MAVETRVCCDRCGSVILEHRTLLKVEAGAMRITRQSIDLCRDCQGLLENFLGSFSPEITEAALPTTSQTTTF